MNFTFYGSLPPLHGCCVEWSGLGQRLLASSSFSLPTTSERVPPQLGFVCDSHEGRKGQEQEEEEEVGEESGRRGRGMRE